VFLKENTRTRGVRDSVADASRLLRSERVLALIVTERDRVEERCPAEIGRF